jgi:hypothetical protein
MIYSLSNVPVERQKIMCAGKTLKDDEWNIPLKNVRNFSQPKICFVILDFLFVFSLEGRNFAFTWN